MREVFVATPLNSSAVRAEHQFGNGISIRAISPILWETAVSKRYLSEHQRDKLSDVRYWLCASDEYPDGVNDVGHELYDKAIQAALAAQIICPTGAKHTFLKFQRLSDGYDQLGGQHPPVLCRSLLGKLIALEDRGFHQDFDSVYAGVARAFAEKTVRIQNPILLLEQGMQNSNPYLATLMFVMGLDMLFQAGKIETFTSRLGGFLGLDTFVFPVLSVSGIQPATIVRDIIHDVYELRNIVAHGQEIPESYRRKINLLGTNGEQINYVDYGWVDLIMESALFMLATTLRTLFIDGIFEEVKDPQKWRSNMALYEHRFKNAGGLQFAKNNGR
jgi:hypothetical protein